MDEYSIIGFDFSIRALSQEWALLAAAPVAVLCANVGSR